MSSTGPKKNAKVAQLSKEDIHAYAKAMMAAMDTPEFTARVREAMGRIPTPNNSEQVMLRYEDVQADFFTNHYKATAAQAGSAAPSEAELSAKVEALDLKEKEGETKEAETDGEKLNGVAIMEQLRSAVKVYTDDETERIITQLCMLVEAKVIALPATVPALKHLYVDSVHGQDAASAVAAMNARGENVMPIVNPSPQMMSIMDMAMKTLTPTQRATLERAQQTMMNGSPPSPEDMRDMFMIQRQLGAFMETMQQFGQLPGSRGGRGGGGRGGRGAARGGMRGK